MNFELSLEQLEYFANVIKDDISSYVQNNQVKYQEFLKKGNKYKEENIDK